MRIPSASVSVVGVNREIFLFSIDGLSFNLDLISIRLPTQTVDSIKASFNVDLIQLDHHSLVLGSRSRNRTPTTQSRPWNVEFPHNGTEIGTDGLPEFGTDGLTEFGTSGGSYVALRCPSSVVPYFELTDSNGTDSSETHLSGAGDRCLNVLFSLRGSREVVAPGGYPQLGHYTVHIETLQATLAPLELRVEVAVLLDDLEDLMASLWTVNSIPGNTI